MKKLFPLAIILFAAAVNGQSLQKVFFNKNRNKCDEKIAYVYQFTTDPEALKVPGFPTHDNDTVVTVYFASSSKVCMRFTCADGYRRGPYELYYENGTLKEKGFTESGFPKGKTINYYPNGNLQEVLVYPTEVSRYTINRYLILDYRDSSGVQIVKDGDGMCRRYFFSNGDSSRIEREDGLLKDGLRDQEWRHYENDTLCYKDTFSHGEFVNGIRYDEGKEILYDEIEHQPEYHGGLEALSRFISSNLRYPKDARKQGVDGKVFVQFIVLKDGRVTDAVVIKGVFPSLDEEAIRVVSFMPVWEPGIQRGKPVKARFVLPIRYQLDGKRR